MKVTFLKAKIVFASILFSSAPGLVWSCPTGTYPMICNGPMNITFTAPAWRDSDRLSFHDTLYEFTPAGIAAGEFGADLPQSSCSWVDRAPRGDELDVTQAVLRYQLEGSDTQRLGQLFHRLSIANTIANCNLDADCRIQVCARSDGTNQYWWEIDSIKIFSN